MRGPPVEERPANPGRNGGPFDGRFGETDGIDDTADGDGAQVWMGHPALPREFRRSLQNRTDDHLAWLYRQGVGYAARDSAGGIGVATIAPAGRTFAFSQSGFPALILANWMPWPPSDDNPRADHWIADLIAFRVQDPGTYWFRIGDGNPILASHLYDDALETGAAVTVYDNPVEWLWDACTGPCFLNDPGAIGGTA